MIALGDDAPRLVTAAAFAWGIVLSLLPYTHTLIYNTIQHTATLPYYILPPPPFPRLPSHSPHPIDALLFGVRSIQLNQLQHTTTYCNTLQHNATLYNTLTHCNQPQHTTTYRNTLQHNATLYNTLTHCNTHLMSLLLLFFYFMKCFPTPSTHLYSPLLLLLSMAWANTTLIFMSGFMNCCPIPLTHLYSPLLLLLSMGWANTAFVFTSAVFTSAAAFERWCPTPLMH